jgi:hypothetical protein
MFHVKVAPVSATIGAIVTKGSTVTSTASPASPDTATTSTVETPSPTRTARDRILAALRRPVSRDLAVCLSFLAFAAWLTHGLWPDPATRVLALNEEDQVLNEWFLAHGSRVLSGDFTLVTDRLNAPDGVNLMANASIIGLGVLLSPVTVTLGAPVSFALATGLNLALTAVAWYLLFSRTLRAHRAAAAVGAALCGFGPSIISQSNSHPHMTAQWLVPALVWCVVKLARAADPDHPDHRRGPRWLLTLAVALAALVCAQLFIGEEVLFLAAVTLLLVTIGYAAAAPARALRCAPRFLAAMLVATATATAVLAYPLWVQFAGPQHVPNGVFNPWYFSADLASFPAFSPLSLAGDPANARLATGPAEYDTFFGWPLLLVALGCGVWLRRTPIVWGIGFASVVMAWLSLGPRIVINGERTRHRGLFALLEGLPVVEAALPMRFALPLVPLLATLLVLALDRALRQPPGEALRLVVVAAVAFALLPIAPKPLPTTGRPAVPEFITAGHWRDCVPPGGVLVPVPLPTPAEPWAMRWATAVNAAFGMPEGFFIGPYAAGGQASMGTYSQPTSHLLREVSRTGQVPAIGDEERAQARRDLAFWNASCVALDPTAPHPESLRTALERLLGPGRQVGGVWTWRVAR